jgi:hypothetical protein
MIKIIIEITSDNLVTINGLPADNLSTVAKKRPRCPSRLKKNNTEKNRVYQRKHKLKKSGHLTPEAEAELNATLQEISSRENNYTIK